MQTMRTLFATSLAMFVLVAGSVFSADVTSVELFWENGKTVAKVDASSPVQFSHETAEAQDGKPFRVVVDLLKSEHKLPTQNFTSLPNCAVTSLRTSQYANMPEKITRLVFDMKAETVYQIRQEGNFVFVSFPDPTAKGFANWTTASWQAPKQPTTPAVKSTPKVASAPTKSDAATINKKTEADRLASLGTEKTATAKPQPKATPTKTVAKAEPQKSEPKATPTKTVAKAEPKKAEPKATPTKTVAKAEPQKSEPKATPTKTVAKAEPKKAEPKATPTKTVAKAEPKKADSKPEAVTTVAKAEEQKPEPTVKTSRFRRTARDRNISGTMVAEFPQRLVIKYESEARRDPFETLIDETRTFDGPIDNQIPNVESLRLVGVIESTRGGNRALFEDNAGYGYILKSGDKVQKGVVLRVETDRVFFQIFEYGWSRTVALNLDID
jgi:hypothetical protein